MHATADCQLTAMHACMCVSLLLQDGGAAGGDADFDDDFMDAAPAASSGRPGAFGSTQQPAASMLATPAATFRPTQTAAAFTSFTRAAAGAAAAGGGSTAGGGASGPAVLVGGGLAGFSGRAEAGHGNPSAIWSPALLPTPHNSSSGGPSQPGFAVGGLAEGLSGLAGVEGAGLRVFAALSPAYGDTAQALMRLWRHMAGLAGWAPPDALLQAVGEAVTTAICTGASTCVARCFSCCYSCAAGCCTCLMVQHQRGALPYTSRVAALSPCRWLGPPAAAVWTADRQQRPPVSPEGAHQHVPPRPAPAAAGGSCCSGSRRVPGRAL
jgi:hypothetical protein